MSPRALTLTLGAAIIVVANGFALAGVALNRSGEAGSRLALSQRELERPAEWGASREDSSLALALNWRLQRTRLEPEGAYWTFGGSPAWLDERRDLDGQQALLAADPGVEQAVRAEQQARERLEREEHDNSRCSRSTSATIWVRCGRNTPSAAAT